MAAFAVAPAYPFAPYCGAPPDPAALESRWNLDPLLLGVLVAIAVAYPWFVRRSRSEAPGPRRLRAAGFYTGWSIGTASLVSPLCALSVSLFSARVGQHMLLETVAAPLVALGLPLNAPGRAPHPLAAAGGFAAMLWFWHAPGPYTATFQGPWVYWLMHITSFGAALWFWRAALRAVRERMGLFLAAMVGTTLQMGFLGALFTFAAHPLFAVHAFTTASWGLAPLQDQQLGGVIMWIPAGAIFLGAIIAATAMTMGRAELRARGRALTAARA